MNARALRVPALVLALAAAGAAPGQPYGLDVPESELRFMFGLHGQAVDLELGRRGRPDPVRAAEQYRKAAVLGLPLAQSALGRLYETGNGVQPDAIHALMWYTLAARSGDPEMRANRDRLRKQLSLEERGLADVLAGELARHLPDVVR